MDGTKRIRITDASQTKMFGICAKSFQELQNKGKERFKDQNTYLIRMKTSQLIKSNQDFIDLSSDGETVKFTSWKPRNLSLQKENETFINLEKISVDMFNIRKFSFKELNDLKMMDTKEFKDHFNNKFLEEVIEKAEKAIAWKELDADSITIRSSPFLCKCTMANKDCIGISLLIQNLNIASLTETLSSNHSVVDEETTKMKEVILSGTSGVMIEPLNNFQTSLIEIDDLKTFKDYFKNGGDDCLMITQSCLMDIFPNKTCFVANLSKGYILFLVFVDEITSEDQFRDCLQSISIGKEKFLDLSDANKNLDSQWLCLCVIFTLSDGGQCKCHICNDFIIIGKDNITHKMTAIEEKIINHQMHWNSLEHLNELIHVYQAFAFKCKNIHSWLQLKSLSCNRLGFLVAID